MVVCLCACVAVAEFEEYELKAVYLERITRFLEWPKKGSAVRREDRFVIGILGEDPFGAKLDDLYAGRRIKERPIEILRLDDPGKAGKCHLLFISGSEAERLPEILAVTGGKPILTVGDTDGFAEKGVLVNLVIEDDRLRFVINEAAFHEAGIRVDSLMLKVARVVAPLKKTE